MVFVVVLCSSQLGIQEAQQPQRKSASAIGWIIDRAIHNMTMQTYMYDVGRLE